jgi:hypothetical protein
VSEQFPDLLVYNGQVYEIGSFPDDFEFKIDEQNVLESHRSLFGKYLENKN